MPERSDPKRRAAAAQAARKRARARRDELSLMVGVLEEMSVPTLPGQPHTSDVAGFFDVDVALIMSIVRAHHQEFVRDGLWRDGDHREWVWSGRSVVRVGLLLAAEQDIRGVDCPVAKELEYRLGEGDLPLVYSTAGGHVASCKASYERATEVVEAVRDTQPDELWRELQSADRYQLQALVVTLAALVPPDMPDLAGWLTELPVPGTDGVGKAQSVAKGLAQLIPKRSPVLSAQTMSRRSRRALLRSRAQ